jgi:hypothetical protein
VTPLVDAATIAELIGTTRDWVYQNADRLGAIRLGDGPRARLRFDPERVERALGSDASDQRAQPARKAAAYADATRSCTRARVPLLPIKGRET